MRNITLEQLGSIQVGFDTNQRVFASGNFATPPTHC